MWNSQVNSFIIINNHNFFRRKEMKKALMILVILALAATAVFAFDGYVTVYNRTGYDIYFLYVSHEDSDDWEDDELGDDILEDGGSVTINLNGKTPIFDIMAEDEDGDTYYFWNLDCEYNDLSLTIDYLD